MVQDPTESLTNLDRRRILQGMGAAGIASVAGCLDALGDGDIDRSEVEDRIEIDPDDIQEGGELVVGMAENVASFDRVEASDTTSSQAVSYFYDGLLTQNADGEVYGWVAEDWEVEEIQDISPADYFENGDYSESAAETDAQILITNPDDPDEVITVDGAGDVVADGLFGVRVRYDLHEGVNFVHPDPDESIDEEITAEHVVRSIERFENTTRGLQQFDSFLYAEEVDTYTVNLYGQLPDAEAALSLPPESIFALEQVDIPAGDLDPRQDNIPIGTGPYVFDSFDDDEQFTVRRNEDWWFSLDLKEDSWDVDIPDGFPDGPVIDTIRHRIIPDDSTRGGALLDDDIHLTYGLASEVLDDYVEDDDFQVRGTPAGGYTFMQFPANVEPWDDPLIRRAVNHLIPRDRIANAIFNGWQDPAWTVIPPLVSEVGSDRDYDEMSDDHRESYTEYDPDEAERLIEEAGVETPIEATLEVNADNSDRVSMTNLIAQAMNDTGLFDVNIDMFEWTTYVTRTSQLDYYDEGVMTVIGLSGSFNPQSFCEALHHPNNHGGCCNFQNINNSDLTEMMDDAQYSIRAVESTEDPDDTWRQGQYDEIWDKILEQNYNSFIVHSWELTVLSNDVVGYNAWPFNSTVVSTPLYHPVEGWLFYLDQE